MRIVSIGEITTDCYLDLRRDYVGGILLNFAVPAQRYGAEAALVRCVGDDVGGQRTSNACVRRRGRPWRVALMPSS